MAEKEIKKLTMKDAIKSINKACKEWNILGSGNFSKNLRKLSMGSMGFDKIFKGGLPYGQIVTFGGVEFSGKSTAAALAISQYQYENPDKVCLYVDAENTLLTQADYFQEICHREGYPPINYEADQFVRYDCTGRSAEEIYSDIITMQGTEDIGLIVIDSVRALISQADLENDFTKDNGQKAATAKASGKFLKQMMMYLPKRQNILLGLMQVEVIKTQFSTSYSEPGGYAWKYFPSVKVRYGTRTYTCGDKTDIMQSKADDKVDGLQLHFAIVKNRLGQIHKEGGFITLRYGRGVDVVHDLMAVALGSKIIQRPTTKTYLLTNMVTGENYTDKDSGELLQFTGEAELEKYLRAHPKFVEDYSNMIFEYLSQNKINVDLVDPAIVDELFEQEAQICGKEMTTAEALIADGVEDDE